MRPCRRCRRHVSYVEATCPFCGASAPTGSTIFAAPEMGLVLVGLASAACGPTVDSDAAPSMASSGATDASTTSDAGTTTTVGTSSSTSTSTSASTGTSSSTGKLGSSGGSGSTGGPLLQCDFWADDCGANEKCVPAVQFCPGFYGAFCVGGEWDQTFCAMVDEDPIAVGETCFIDSLGSGVDDCEAAAYCVLGTPADGVCTPYCGGSPDAPVCDNPDTACALLGGVDLPLCMPTCDSDSDCGDYSTCEDRGFGQTTCIPGGY